MGRNQVEGWDDEQGDQGRRQRPRRGRPVEPARLSRQPRRRIEVYRCPGCHEPCVSARDLQEHLADCAACV